MKKQQQPKDPHLDAPSVANEDKHINFLAEEKKARKVAGEIDLQNQEDDQRKKEWQKGIEEGKKDNFNDTRP